MRTKISWVICGQCNSMQDVPKGAEIERINDRDVLYKCDGCGKLILEGDKSFSGEDCTLCPSCFKELLTADGEK